MVIAHKVHTLYSSCYQSMQQLNKVIQVSPEIHTLCSTLAPLRGYRTPDQFSDCLCILLKNYNTLVTSKICFLKVTFQGT